jgi:hypothetical protein
MWSPTAAPATIHCVTCTGKGTAQNGHCEIGPEKQNNEIKDKRDNDMKEVMNIS